MTLVILMLIMALFAVFFVLHSIASIINDWKFKKWYDEDIVMATIVTLSSIGFIVFCIRYFVS